MNNKLYIPFFALLLLTTIVKAQNVGINLDNNTLPTATLEVNGNMMVRHPDDITGQKLPFLYKDNNGQIVAGKHKEGYMYSVQFDIFTEKKWAGRIDYYSDIITKYNTKVPSDKYFMIVMGATLMQRKTVDNKDEPAFLQKSITERYPFKEVKLSKENGNGNWILKADYPSANPSMNEHKYGRIFWRIKALIIKNEYIGFLGAEKGDRDARQPDDLQAAFEASQFTIGGELPIDFPVGNPVELEKYTNKEGVGINTEKPILELDVKGNVVLKDIKKAPLSDLTPLFLGNKKEEEGRFGVSAEGKPFTVLSGRVNCKGTSSHKPELGLWGDWIENFDTKIPTKTHTLMLSDAYLENDYYIKNMKDIKRGGDGGYAYIYGIARTINPHDTSENMNPQEVINVFKGGVQGEETWRLKADYPANPVCGKLNVRPEGKDNGRQDYYWLTNTEDCKDKYSWNFRLLAISNAFITDLGVFEDDFRRKSGETVADSKNTPYDVKAQTFIPDDKDFVQYMLKKLESR